MTKTAWEGHTPTEAVIKGSGFNSRGGGFTRIHVDGVKFTANEVARRVNTYPALEAERDALREALEAMEGLVKDMQALAVMYLEPCDRRLQSEHDFANAIIERLDGPKQRKEQGLARQALAISEKSE